jgi:hypothetical protein
MTCGSAVAARSMTLSGASGAKPSSGYVAQSNQARFPCANRSGERYNRRMNWLQQFSLRLVCRICPPLRKLLNSAGGTIERAETELTILRERDSTRKQAIREEQQELREAIQMIAPSWLPAIQPGASMPRAGSLREAGAPAGVIKCVERLWELELALEDRGWVRELTLANFEFSLFGIHRIIAMCRLYFLKNPFVRRGIEVSSFYVVGRGVTITSPDPDVDEVIQDFFNNPKNQSELGYAGLLRRIQARWTDGNIYSILFGDPKTGEQLIRSIDPIEIVEIVNDPDDVSVERYIHRRWMSQQFDEVSGQRSPKGVEAWYPALGYNPATKPPMIQNVKVMWDTPVLHEKAGGFSKWQMGVPLAYAALDYARAARKIIDNWCTIQEALARFSWQVETQGGIPAIANFKQTLATTLMSGDGQYEQNPPPNVASAFVTGPGNKLQPIRTAGTVDSPEVGRRVCHLIYMVFGLPETFFADASVGTVATATSLDRPTELKFLQAQEQLREVLQQIVYYVIEQSESAAGGKLREARKTKKAASERPTVNVVFPSILEHDILAQIQAIVAAMTLGDTQGTVVGIDERIGIGLLLQELNVEDWQNVLEAMYPEDDYDDITDRTPALAKGQQDVLDPPKPPAPVAPLGLPAPADHTVAPAAAPAPAPPAKAKPKATADKVERAIAALNRAAQTMREGKRNGTHTGKV